MCWWPMTATSPAASLAAAREALLDGRATLADVAREHGWKLAPESLTFAGRWQTPVFAPVRFDTLFFLCRLPYGQAPSVIPGELASGEWVRPMEALDRYRRGKLTFAAPILWTLIALAEGEEGLAARIAQGPARAATPVRRVELQWGVVLHAMPTEAAAARAHTNAYLIGETRDGARGPGQRRARATFATCSHSPTISRARGAVSR